MAGKPLLEVGEAALRAGKLERAVAIFRRIVDRCPPSLDTLAAIAYLRTASNMNGRSSR